MKIKVEVDLQDLIDDMFHDEDSDLTENVKSEITRKLVSQVTEKFQVNIDKLLSERITPQIDTLIDSRVSSALDALIDAGEMTVRGEKVIIADYVRRQFEQNTGWTSPSEKIAKIAKEFGAELKAQYNNCFAMNIVKNLSEQGLLNDDVAKALLAPPKN
jgi:DNA-binding phage protein